MLVQVKNPAFLWKTPQIHEKIRKKRENFSNFSNITGKV